MRVIVKLHNAVTVPTLLYCLETWEKNKIDKFKIWAGKKTIGLPKTTPTPAYIYAIKAIISLVKTEISMLIYFYKILNKGHGH